MAIQVTRPARFYTLLVLGLIAIVLVVLRIFIGGATVQQDGEFVIVPGTSSREVWQLLVDEKFSSGTLAWKYYSWREGAADKIQAGAYQMTKGETVKEVMRRLITGDAVSDELSITYPEGFTLVQMAERTAGKGIGTKEEFTKAASDLVIYSDDFPFVLDIPSNRDLEGYLFPDTYRVFEDDTPEDVIKRMLGNFDRRVIESGLADEATKSGRQLDDMINMASIVEREVQKDDDMALVSGVLWKRLDEGIGLAADATTRYVLDKPTGTLTAKDLEVDSAYNTRKYRGLPPGPISNPGIRAITAAVQPESSKFYYYLSAPSGETIFSETNTEHNQNKVKYLR